MLKCGAAKSCAKHNNLHNAHQNCEMNSLSWSQLIAHGSLFSQYQWVKNFSVHSSAVSIVYVVIICTSEPKRFMWYFESVVVCCIVSVHCLNLGQSSKNFWFLLQFVECLAWFGVWWVECDLSKGLRVQVFFYKYSPFFGDNFWPLFPIIWQCFR
jgi:hypothetical protein